MTDTSAGYPVDVGFQVRSVGVTPAEQSVPQWLVPLDTSSQDPTATETLKWSGRSEIFHRPRQG